MTSCTCRRIRRLCVTGLGAAAPPISARGPIEGSATAGGAAISHPRTCGGGKSLGRRSPRNVTSDPHAPVFPRGGAPAPPPVAFVGGALGLGGVWGPVRLPWRAGNRLRERLAAHALRLEQAWHGRHSPGQLIE